MILYTRKDNPTPGLKKFVKYVVQVYCPIWFLIKKNSKFTSGPSHLFTLMKLIKTQSKEVQTVVMPVV